PPPPPPPPAAPATPTTPASTPAPVVNIDSYDDKAWRDTLLNVSAILCERQPDSPQGYRLRRHALWHSITSAPQAESDRSTPLAAFPADMMDDYLARLNNADMALWQQVEKSVLLAPYWFDGHYLSAQAAQRLGYTRVADAIRDETAHFLARLPQLAALRFNDRTPFIAEPTKQWLASSSAGSNAAPAVQTDEELQAVRACFDAQGLEAALHHLETLPAGDPRDQFYRQYLGAQLLGEAGMGQPAQQQYPLLFRLGLQMVLTGWEPVLLVALET
ncbi:type VI secretion system protein TssA, partial [Enterobacter hormaechei]|uniref:type VI secretion system protein TssA n=1 Tax=Enterobacter hormaechei TaxID=158836 RepID=UPI0007DC3BB2